MDTHGSREDVAQDVAQQIATLEGWELGRQVYSYADTDQAAAWYLRGDGGDVRLAVNVEDLSRPRPVLEAGPMEDPRYKMRWTHLSIGWVRQPVDMAGKGQD